MIFGLSREQFPLQRIRFDAAAQRLDLIDKLIHVLESSMNRGVSKISHLIELTQFFQNFHADGGGGNFAPARLEFVDDVIDAIVRAVGLAGTGDVINVGSGRAYSNDEVAACVAATLGQPVRIESGAFQPRAGETPLRLADRTKAARVLGWRPQFTLKEGIARTVNWFRAHPSAWSATDDAPPVVI
jgi:nucleoside-diphosphate-sugar epimerase